MLTCVDTPFLQGRAFVFASQYVSILPKSLAGQYLAATVSALDADATEIATPVKLSAVKCIRK
jgi:hypothetical protein